MAIRLWGCRNLLVVVWVRDELRWGGYVRLGVDRMRWMLGMGLGGRPVEVPVPRKRSWRGDISV